MEYTNEELEAFKHTCPRLYLLSSFELKALLSDPTRLTAPLNKNLGINGTLMFDDNKVTGLTDQGEMLRFDEPVAVQAVPETLNAVVEASQKAVKREIANAMDHIELPVVDLLQSNFINQAIQAVYKVKETRDTEEATKDGVKGLTCYLEVLNQKLSDLSYLQIDSLPKNKQELRRVLLALAVNQRNYVQDYLIPAVEQVRPGNNLNQEFNSSLRFYWQDNTLKASVDAYELNCGSEYLGVHEVLAVTPLTRKAYIAHGQALCQGGYLSKEGPAGTGKTETAKDFYRHLNRFMIVINCSDQMNHKTFTQLLECATKGGFAICFDEFNRVTPDVIEQVLPIFKEFFWGKKQTGLVVTCNPGYAGRTMLPPHFYHTFTRFNMTIPDRSCIAQKLMYNHGFGASADNLSKLFANMLSECENKLSKQRHYDFGMRTLLSTIRQCGAMVQNKVAPDNALYSVMRDNFVSLLTQEDIPIFMELLNQTLQAQPIESQTEEFDGKFAQVCPDASAEIKEKARQIYNKSLTRHGIMVLGQDSKIVENVAASCGFTSCTIDVAHSAEGEKPDKIDEMINAVKDNFIKHADTKGHWIILKETESTHWAISFETFNTVCDDNKVLMLASGESVKMPEGCRIVVVGTNTETMTPAMVSRLGVINMMN